MTSFVTYFIIGLIGVIIGSFIAITCFFLALRYERRRDLRRRNLELKVKEIETLQLLNKKTREILHKRHSSLPEIISFDKFDDLHVQFDDYTYLQSFAAQNNFYLPSFILEEFFEQISHRRIVLSPEESVQLDGYTFKEGRVVLENFADDLQKMIEERKSHIKQVSDQPIPLILREKNYF